ncbi:MAG: hypothetical protein AB7I41_25015 [Candidatus Sericytochromatia bacterium]
MSLEAYQNTWLALMLAPQSREKLLAICPEGLSADEYLALCQTPQARLEAISDAVQRGRVSVLSASVPGYLRRLMTAETTLALAERYAYAYPAAVVYPPALGLYNWLDWLSQQPELRESWLLQDLLAYEMGLTQLQFYRKPNTSASLSVKTSASLSAPIGPRLSPRVGLIVASPYLDQLLLGLEAEEDFQVPETEDTLLSQKQGWLLARWGSQVERIALHWSVYTLLGNLDGQSSWESAVKRTVQSHPELEPQTATLMAWQRWFEKKRLLT